MTLLNFSSCPFFSLLTAPPPCRRRNTGAVRGQVRILFHPRTSRAVHPPSLSPSSLARASGGRFPYHPVCVKHSLNHNVIINSPTSTTHNHLSGFFLPRHLIGREHATSARRGASRRVPLFKPTQRLETPEKESRTRPESLLHTHTNTQTVRNCEFLGTPPNTVIGGTFSCYFGNMDVLTVEEWSKGAREVAALGALQQERVSTGVVERGGNHQLEVSRYDPGHTLVDGGSDPRAWLTDASGTCAAHATSPDYLRHSPCPSTGSYQGERPHYT